MKKVPLCNVKLYKTKGVKFDDNDKEESKIEEEFDEKKTLDEVEDTFGEDIKEDDVKDLNRVRTRSMERERENWRRIVYQLFG